MAHAPLLLPDPSLRLRLRPQTGVGGVTAKEVLSLMLITQYYDTLKVRGQGVVGECTYRPCCPLPVR